MSEDSLDPRLAERLTRAARAAQTLSETLWEALGEELAEPHSERVAELSQRLGEVAAIVALLARADARVPQPPAAPATPAARSTGDAGAAEWPVASAAGVAAGSSAPPWGPGASIQPRTAAVLVDEMAPVEPPGTGEPLARARPEIEIRDVRGEEGPAAWIGSIGRRLERHAQDSSPFAVLLVELVDIEHLHSAWPKGSVSSLVSQVEDALARELRPADSFTRERPGRYWLIAGLTDGAGARVLAGRLATAVRSSASHRDSAPEVVVGIAVCPDDGLQASALAAHADVGLYAARAAGRPFD
ncbi:MAG TPA: diguanylate cyclase [Solirubrobacteraceae bacterium]|nr:diguanylate cyclase [Solirubrobacteraceae bacterium]